MHDGRLNRYIALIKARLDLLVSFLSLSPPSTVYVNVLQFLVFDLIKTSVSSQYCLVYLLSETSFQGISHIV